MLIPLGGYIMRVFPRSSHLFLLKLKQLHNSDQNSFSETDVSLPRTYLYFHEKYNVVNTTWYFPLGWKKRWNPCSRKVPQCAYITLELSFMWVCFQCCSWQYNWFCCLETELYHLVSWKDLHFPNYELKCQRGKIPCFLSPVCEWVFRTGSPLKGSYLVQQEKIILTVISSILGIFVSHLWKIDDLKYQYDEIQIFYSM